MFFYKNWEKFCAFISESGISTLRACDVLDGEKPQQFVIFKHDVETNPRKALRLAEIESDHGIVGSYYVQAYLLDNPENIHYLKEIRKMGHEVSYHYDVLDANNGDFAMAREEFKRYFEKFESFGFLVRTVCQHGNPVMNRIGYTSNRDFFRDQKVQEEYEGIADIVVNFKQETGAKYLYVSDAGYSWKLISNPENNDRDKSQADILIDGFQGIKELILDGNSLIVSTHPHRWKDSQWGIAWKIWCFKIVRGIINLVRTVPLANRVLSKFYFLAKKI